MDKKIIVFLYFISSILLFSSTNFLIEKYAQFNYHQSIEIFIELTYIIVTSVLLYFLILRLQQLKTLKEDKKRLSTLINSMVDFVTFKDGEGRWIEANDFGLKVFQLENVDYRGKKDSELAEYSDFCRDAFLFCEESDEAAWRNGKITRNEESIPTPDGTERIFDIIKVPLYEPTGERKGIVIIGHDVTDLRLAQEQLRRTEKLSVVGELAASVVHEIRNPLTSLRGFVQLLGERDNEHQHYYDIMNDELERINHIVGELLLLAKPQTIKFMQSNLKKIIYDVVSLLEIQAIHQNVVIEVHCDKNLEEIECEPNQLKQLFINLIKNAVEASVEGGKVDIFVKRSDHASLSVLIKDNGCGISKERLERMGEPFYSSKEKGTGLGLTVSSKIVQTHQGKITFDSKLDEGTEVLIDLPIHHQNKI